MQTDNYLSSILQKITQPGADHSNFLSQHLPASVDFGGIPACPLARSIEMPSGHGYETGLLSFRIESLLARGTNLVDPSSPIGKIDGNYLWVRFGLGPLNITGTYVLEAKNDPKVLMDTGGNLVDLASGSNDPLPAGADTGDGIDEIRRLQYMENARRQREKLSGTANGKKLVDQFYEHNEVYNTCFRESQSFRRTWRAGGATAEMAADTDSAVNNDTVINQPAKTYQSDRGPVTYNQNAFAQQLGIITACIYQDPGFNPFKDYSYDPENKFVKASLAALSFGKAVNSTGNDKSKTKEMTQSEVYRSVDDHSGEVPETSSEELRAIFTHGRQPGGAEFDEDLAVRQGWVVLDEEDRLYVRSLCENFMRERMEAENNIAIPLWQGNCEATIHQVEVELELGLSNASSMPTVHVVEVKINLPEFELDIDDSAWFGIAGDAARQGLMDAYFIHDLLQDKITDRLHNVVISSVSNALDSLTLPWN